ncbi:MAG: hypothetical protein ABEJ89_03315 [Haloarculaceae archaeon]
MPLKATGPATEPREIDRWEGGVGWIAHPEEDIQRASHALVVDGDVWVIDPVDTPDLDERLADLGDVAGVVVLCDRHVRDAPAIARRHGVAVHVPVWMRGVVDDLDVPVELIRRTLGGTGYELYRLFDNPLWREGALYDDDSGALVVPESVGTVPDFLVGSERLGVHPALRLTPPRTLRQFAPERVLVGHGAGVFEDATAALHDALDNARRRAPRFYAETVRRFLSG